MSSEARQSSPSPQERDKSGTTYSLPLRQDALSGGQVSYQNETSPLPSLPRRGEIWDVNWSPGRGAEQQGTRPALIIQNDRGNASTTYPLTIVA